MSEPSTTGFWARTLRGAKELWLDLGSGADGAFPAGPDLTARDEGPLLKQMQACLDAEGGEVSARQRAARLGQVYLELGPAGRARFLSLLATHFDPDKKALDAAIERYRAAHDDGAARLAQHEMRRLARPPRLSLLTQFNALPQGVKFLADMRADLLSFKKEAPELEALDRDFQDLLASWFDIGFLEMQSISWDSPASLLEKLIAYEAVHEIRSWHDLRNRLESDRRLFAFFHPRMPTEPLIFVEVALVNGIAGHIQTLLDESEPIVDPRKADTAIFYSISNTQRGLRGISFGNFLIKRVVDSLRAELPNLKTFATLSPIPGFRKWLEASVQMGKPRILTADDRKRLRRATGKTIAKGHLIGLLDDPVWMDQPALSEALRPALLRLCARYLVEEKSPRGQPPPPLDSVARFHLSNGAQIERINWMGDSSAKGIAQSAGMMVNYLYRFNDIEKNHEKLMSEGTVAVSGSVKSLI